MKKKIITVILSAMLAASLWGCNSESVTSNEDLEDENLLDESISAQSVSISESREDDKEKISVFTSVLGMPVNDDGGIELDRDTVELFNDASLFGYDGTVEAKSNLTKINIVDWTTNEEYGESEEFEDIVDGLKSLYGKCAYEQKDYVGILGDAYIWLEGVYDCEMVACGLKETGGTNQIAIYWFYNISDSEDDSETNDKLGDPQLIAAEMRTYDSSSEISDSELEEGLSIIEERLEYAEQSLDAISEAFDIDDEAENTDSIINEKPTDLFGLSGNFQFGEYNSKIYIYYELPQKSSYKDAAYLFDCIRRLFGECDRIEPNDKYVSVRAYWDSVDIISKRWKVCLFYNEEGDFSLSFELLGDNENEDDSSEATNEATTEAAASSSSGSGGMRLPRTSNSSSTSFSGNSSTASSSSNSSSSGSSTSHTCAASGCDKTGTHAIIGISGETEYYCSEHYAEMNAMVDSMENSVGTTHTCAASGCDKTGTRSIIGVSGQREYYCEEHYKKMQNMVDDMLGE